MSGGKRALHCNISRTALVIMREFVHNVAGIGEEVREIAHDERGDESADDAMEGMRHGLPGKAGESAHERGAG